MTYRVREASRYRDRFYHWAVIRLLPKMQHIVVAHCHSCSDADGYATTLKRLAPDALFIVVLHYVIELGRVIFESRAALENNSLDLSA